MTTFIIHLGTETILDAHDGVVIINADGNIEEHDLLDMSESVGTPWATYAARVDYDQEERLEVIDALDLLRYTLAEYSDDDTEDRLTIINNLLNKLRY
jgi:hypothetical protein